MNANQRTGNVVRLSAILPPVLAALRDRMRQGEHVSAEEMRNALRTMKPLELPEVNR